MKYCKLCKWCFKPVLDDDETFIVTKEWDFLHSKCYDEYVNVIKQQEISSQDEEE